jgi:hypothetical protein
MKNPAMKLNDILEIEPLSKALQRTLRLAHEHGTNELAMWLQLELGGYYDSNSAMNTSITVPKYRTIVGAHFNIYGQRLQLPHDLSFVNEMRLREGVEALESLRDTRQTVVLQDPTMIGLIAKHLKVEVATFHFDSVELVQVLSQIRTELFSKAQVFADSLPKQKTAKTADCEEIVMLNQTFTELALIFAHSGGKQRAGRARGSGWLAGHPGVTSRKGPLRTLRATDRYHSRCPF